MNLNDIIRIRSKNDLDRVASWRHRGLYYWPQAHISSSEGGKEDHLFLHRRAGAFRSRLDKIIFWDHETHR